MWLDGRLFCDLKSEVRDSLELGLYFFFILSTPKKLNFEIKLVMYKVLLLGNAVLHVMLLYLYMNLIRYNESIALNKQWLLGILFNLILIPFVLNQKKNKSECQKSLMMREHLEISNQNHLKYLKYRKQKKKLDNLTGKK